MQVLGGVLERFKVQYLQEKLLNGRHFHAKSDMREREK